MQYTNPNDPWQHRDPCQGLSARQRFLAGCLQQLVAVVVVALTLLLCLMLSGCTTVRYVDRIRTDTIIRQQTLRDSIIVRDSTIIRQQGDTIYVDRWHTRWRERLQRDTIREARTDSIPVPFEIEKYIARPLSWWQRTQMLAGDAFLLLITALSGYGIFRILRRLNIIKL